MELLCPHCPPIMAGCLSMSLSPPHARRAHALNCGGVRKLADLSRRASMMMACMKFVRRCPMAAKHYGTFTILDFSEEKSPVSFSFGGVTALNIAGFLTQFGNLRTALGAIIKGTVQKENG